MGQRAPIIRAAATWAFVGALFAPAYSQPPRPPAVSPNRPVAVKSAPSPDASPAPLNAFRDAIFLLYRDFDRLGDPDLVVVPTRIWEEFLKAEVAKRQKGKQLDWSISSVSLTGTIGDDRVQFEMEVAARVDGSNGATIDLALHEAHLTQATMTPAGVPTLRREPGGGYQALVDRAGVYTFRLAFFVDVDRGATDSRAVLSLPAAPVKSVQLTCPEPLAFARDGKTGKTFELSTDGRAIRPALRGEDSLNLAWRTASDRRLSGFSAVSATGTVFYRLGESMIESEAQLRVEARGESREWIFLLPAGEQVRLVSAEKQGRLLDPQSEVFPEEKQSRLRVRFSEPQSGTVNVRIVTERPRGEANKPFELGRVEMENAESQKGLILVFTGPDLSVKVTPKRGVQRIAPSQIEPTLQRDQPYRVFRYYLQPATVDVEVQPARPAISATSRTDVSVSADIAELSTQFRFSIRGAHTDRLTIRAPAELTQIAVSPPEIKIESTRGESAGWQEIQLTMAEPKIGDVDVALRGSIPLKAGGAVVLRLPSTTKGVDCSGVLAVRESSNAKLTFQSDATKNLRRQPLPPPEESASEPLWYFRHSRGPAELAFKLERLARRVEASIEAELRRAESGVFVRARMSFLAKHEPLEEVTLRIPQGVRDARVEGDNLLARDRLAPGDVIVPLANPSDACDLIVSYAAAFADGEGRQTEIPIVLPTGASITSYKADVWAAAGLTAMAAPPWESGPPSPSRAVVAGERPVLAVRSKAPPESLSIRFEPNAALTALLIPRVLIEEVVSQGRRLGILRLVVARRRSPTASFRLPERCRLLEVFIDGEPATFTPEDRVCRVRLPTGDQPCSLEIIYDGDLGRTLGAWSLLPLQCPALLEDAAIEDVRWVFTVSQDRLLMNLSPDVTSDLAWRWMGFLRSPGPSSSPATMTEWLVASDRSLRWAKPILGEPISGLAVRQWIFETWGNADRLELFAVREPFWILIGSGLSLVVGTLIARLTPRGQVRVAMVIAILAAASFLMVPNLAKWIWVGAQWGVIAAGVAILLRLAFRGRAPVLLRRMRIGRPGVANASSLLRRAPGPLGASTQTLGASVEARR